jgi:hypothetical protein
MACSLKTRAMSHAYRALITPEGRKVAKSMRVSIDDILVTPIPSSLSSWDDSYPKTFRPLLEMMRLRLSEHNMGAIVWLGMFMKESENQKIPMKTFLPRRRTTQPMILVWLVLKEFLDIRVWTVLLDAYLTLTENRPFLMTAMMMVLYQVEYEPFTIKPEDINWNYDFVVQEYAIDKHTYQGRKKGMTRQNFVHEGAKLVNEDMDFDIPDYRKVYEA